MIFIALGCLSLLPLAAWAKDEAAEGGVFSFRNDTGGIFPHADAPLEWAAERNVVWKTPLSKRSNASPVIVGGRVFVLDEPDRLICIDQQNGKIFWERTHSREEILGPSSTSKTRKRPDWLEAYGYTTPTPVSDGRHVWCVFGNGVVVCYDLSGRREWAAELDVESKISGLAVSPCLVDGVLIAGGKGRERLCGFDASSGRKLWASDEGTQEGSCVPVQLDGRTRVLASAGILFDPKSGEILERGLLGAGFKGNANRQPVNWGPTVVGENGVAFFHVHFQPDQYTAALRAVRIHSNGPGEQIWEVYTNDDGNIRGRMGNSPLVFQGLLYAIKDSGLLQVFDASDGKLVYEQQLPKHTYSSLALAGDHIFAFGANFVTVFKPGRAYEQVAQFRHGFRDFVASPVFEGRRLYFRDATGLWCIEKAAAKQTANGIPPRPPLFKGGRTDDDDGPDLSDTAKDAPLLSYYEWMLEYDQTRRWLRIFSASVEWCAALATLLFVAWKIVRVRAAPSRAWKIALLLLAAVTLPWLFIADRIGNPYYPVLAWCLSGTLISLSYLQAPWRPRFARPVTIAPSNGVRELSWGWVLGGAVGVVIHHLPVQLVLIAYVLKG